MRVDCEQGLFLVTVLCITFNTFKVKFQALFTCGLTYKPVRTLVVVTALCLRSRLSSFPVSFRAFRSFRFFF